jgi:hypothetical protein
MRAASTWRTSAAVRAIASNTIGEYEALWQVRQKEALTESDAESGTGTNGVILQLIMDEAEDEDEEVQEEPDAIEEPATTVVDHPVPELGQSPDRHVFSRRFGASGVVALKAL